MLCLIDIYGQGQVTHHVAWVVIFTQREDVFYQPVRIRSVQGCLCFFYGHMILGLMLVDVMSKHPMRANDLSLKTVGAAQTKHS